MSSGPHPHVDTASQRPATGLDQGARHLILRPVFEAFLQASISAPSPQIIVNWFFRDRYGSYEDYLNGVEAVWGGAVRFRLADAVAQAQVEAEFPVNSIAPGDPTVAGAYALLLAMPEPDFRLAIEEALRQLKRLEDAADRITSICRNRGIPWHLDGQRGWEWIGDQTIAEVVIAPALSQTLPEFGVR